jgi:hypothetical protein
MGEHELVALASWCQGHHPSVPGILLPAHTKIVHKELKVLRVMV